MKPVTVIMQAFGSYLERTECDFTKLDKNRLFLITGPTGCGKTTILDAICFALYGEATGGMRTFRDMRTMGADDNIDSLVDFVFLLNREKYRFIRTLHIHHKRTGKVEERIEAECYRMGGDGWELIASGSEKVKTAARDLLGLGADQLTQVMILPQGEFRKLLLSKSNEKMAILQVLFGSSRWQRIAEALSRRKNDLKAQLQGNQQHAAGLLGSVSAESEEHLGSKIKEAEQARQEAEALYQLQSGKLQKEEETFRAATALYSAFVELDAALKKISEAEQNRPKIEESKKQLERQEKIRQIWPYYNQYNLSVNKLNDKNIALNESEKALSLRQKDLEATEEASKGLPALKDEENRLRAKILRLSSILEPAAAYAENLDALQKVTEKLAAAERQDKSLEQELGVIKTRTEKGSAMIALQLERISKLPELLVQQTELQRQVDLFKQREALKKDIFTADKARLEAESRLAKAIPALQAAERALRDAGEKVKADSAYYLSKGLTAGIPCPVCGSLSHPDPAGPVSGTPTPAEMSSLQKLAEDLKKQADGYREELASVTARLDQLGRDYADIEKKRGDFQMSIKTAGALKDLSEQVALARDAEKDYSKYKILLDNLQTKQKDYESRRESIRLEVTAGTAEKAKLETVIEDFRKRLPEGFHPADLQKELDAVKTKAGKLVESAEEISRRHQTAQLQYKEAEGTLAAARQALTEAASEKDEAEAAFLAQCGEKGLDRGKDFTAAPMDEKESALLQTRIMEYEKERERLSSRREELEMQTAGQTPPDMNAAAAALEEIKTRCNHTLEQLGVSRQVFENLRDVNRKLEKTRKNSSNLEKTYSATAKVADYLNGINPRRTPIQSFVLGLMLDEVMLAASRYMLQFSRGRYSLVRTDLSEAKAGNPLRGLDIEVTDGHLGGTRKISTLSGGELFLASLSLAFGLSEVVQSMAGGIPLDAIFIDEGFGTLDSETLETAMRALTGIQKEGRMVGIISHVAELKDRIPAKIEVERLGGQSRLSIHVYDA